MKRTFLYTAIFTLLFTVIATAVSTSYIRDISFDRPEDYSFSNVTFIEGRGVQLARKTEDYYSADSIIWSLARHDNAFLVGSGDSAEIIEIRDGTSRSVFSDTERMIVSDIEVVDDSIFASVLPDAVIYQLDNQYNVEAEYSIASKYIWDIVPDEDGLYLLAGNPGGLYYYSDGEVELIADMSNQNNLIKGKLIAGELYFCGDSTFYKWNGYRVVALADFENTVVDFDLIAGEIYLLSASKDLASISGRANEQNQVITSYGDVAASEVAKTSSLYRVAFDGTTELVLENTDIKFLALSELDNNIIIGTAKDGGYYEVSLDGGTRKFTSLGEGKFLKFYEMDDEIYGLMMYPDRIVRMTEEYAEEGSLISTIYDTGNISFWGNMETETTEYPDSGIRFMTRSGSVWDEEYWESWQVAGNAIESSPGRFLRYKVSFFSTGEYSPIFEGISIPYVANNVSPVISSFDHSYNSEYIKLSWSAYDENSDILSYDIYLSRDDSTWIKLNEDKIETTSFEINYHDFPSGKYRAKLVATDEKSNVEGLELTAYRTGNYFYIDNGLPTISNLEVTERNGSYWLSFSANDSYMPINFAEYSVNGKEWISILSEDLICDSQLESFEVQIDIEPPAFVQVRVKDLFGNTVTEGVLARN